jgi:heme/copper-type cytochrome/quinol oxidase subunit 2
MSQPVAAAIFWIAALMCLVAEIAVLRSTYLARGANKSALVPAAPRAREITWAVIPAIALVVLLTATWQKIEARGAHMQMMDHSSMPGMSMPDATPPAPQR